MLQVLNTILNNWQYILIGLIFATITIWVAVYQTKGNLVRKNARNRELEKSHTFKKYQVTEVDINTLNERDDF